MTNTRRKTFSTSVAAKRVGLTSIMLQMTNTCRKTFSTSVAAKRIGLTSIMLALLSGCIMVARVFGCGGNDCTNNSIWWLCLMVGVAVILVYDRYRGQG